MTEDLIEFPKEPYQWFLQAIYSAIFFVVAIKLSGITAAVLIVIAFNSLFLAKPVKISIDPKTKTLKYSYRKLYAFRKPHEIDLSIYSRIYSQIESYAGRSLHLSGPKGEHLLLAKFNQNPMSANQHIHEIKALREILASALELKDGGDT
ncbi:MAG: hypothetical protein ACI9EB_000999 [Pseudomonas sp.]|jgi:hypothetical protein